MIMLDTLGFDGVTSLPKDRETFVPRWYYHLA